MYVIGSKKEDAFNGQMANTVFQVTSKPPKIAVCISKENLTHDFISESKLFSVSVLCQDTPISFIVRFGFNSGRDFDKLDGINYEIGATGVPIIVENAASFLEAKVMGVFNVGTHTIFVGEAVEGEVISEKECMTYDYYRQVKHGVVPRTAPSYVKE